MPKLSAVENKFEFQQYGYDWWIKPWWEKPFNGWFEGYHKLEESTMHDRLKLQL